MAGYAPLFRGFTPMLEIDIDGKPIASPFWSILVSCKITDNEGEEVDRISLKLDDRFNAIELPRKGAIITARIGFRERLPLIEKGQFKVTKFPIEGSVESGEFLMIEGEAVDLRKDAKGEGRKAYKKQKFGAIVQAEAKAMGLQAVVPDSLANIAFDYKLRWNQSRIDFLTRLANEIGGIVKPAGGKLIVQERGSGKSASGQDLAPIVIMREDCISWSGDPSGRMQYGEVHSTWRDAKTGKLKTEKEQTGLQGPARILREHFPDQQRAKKAGTAEKGRINRETGNASFVMYGRPEAQAGAPVQAVDFRSGLRGEWRATTVEHTFEPGDNGGYTSTVSVKAKEDGKRGKDDE